MNTPPVVPNMPRVDVPEHDGGLRPALTGDGRVNDLYMGVERQARLGTESFGVTGYTIESIVFDGAKLYCYAEPTHWWSTAGEPTVCKIIDVSNGVDAGEWTVYDERENTVPTPDGEARLLWERTD